MTDKRTAILQGTLELVAERGFHDTPVSQIAKRSGVSAGIIYHYFDNKDALIRELYREIKLRFGAALITPDLETLPFAGQIKRIWLNAYRFYAAHPLETLFLEQYESSPYQDAVTFADYDENTRQLIAMIENGFASGLLKPLPFEVLYEMTFRVAMNLARRHISGAVTLDEATLDIIADGLCAAVLAGE